MDKDNRIKDLAYAHREINICLVQFYIPRIPRLQRELLGEWMCMHAQEGKMYFQLWERTNKESKNSDSDAIYAYHCLHLPCIDTKRSDSPFFITLCWIESQRYRCRRTKEVLITKRETREHTRIHISNWKIIFAECAVCTCVCVSEWVLS